MYGIIISLSILVSCFLAERIALKKGKNIEVFWGAVFWVILFGVVGARLYHVIDLWEYYLAFPVRIFMIWQGGLGIIGGLVGGVAALVVYLKTKGEDVLEWLDIAALVLPLGQIIGRWGNVFNRELLPAAYYEMGLNLILLVVLWMFKDRLPRPGMLFGIYVAGYLLIRIFLQGYR